MMFHGSGACSWFWIGGDAGAATRPAAPAWAWYEAVSGRVSSVWLEHIVYTD